MHSSVVNQCSIVLLVGGVRHSKKMLLPDCYQVTTVLPRVLVHSITSKGKKSREKLLHWQSDSSITLLSMCHMHCAYISNIGLGHYTLLLLLPQANPKAKQIQVTDAYIYFLGLQREKKVICIPYVRQFILADEAKLQSFAHFDAILSSGRYPVTRASQKQLRTRSTF